MLLEGNGVKPDYKEAANLFQKAAEWKIPQAEHSLGVMYEYGLGVEANFPMAAKFYK